MELSHSARRLTLDAVKQLHKRPTGKGGLLSPAHFRGRHHLHRLSDLRGAADGSNPSSQIARAIHRESSLLISRTYTARRLAAVTLSASFPSFFELVGCSFHLSRQWGAERFFHCNFLEQFRLPST